MRSVFLLFDTNQCKAFCISEFEKPNCPISE